MTKKKLLSLICIIVLLNFSVATFLNYKSVRNNESMILNEKYTHILESFDSALYAEGLDAVEIYCPAVEKGDCTYAQFLINNLESNLNIDFPYVIGFISTEQKIVAHRRSNIYIINYKEDPFSAVGITEYIDIEHCLTNELKEIIADLHKNFWTLKNVGLRTDKTGFCEPTELIYTNINDKTETTVSLNNGTTEKYIIEDEGDNIFFGFDFFNTAGYKFEKNYYTELYNEMQIFAEKNHTFHSGGGFSDSDERMSYSPVTIKEEDYIFYFYAKSNLTMRTLHSDLFKYLQQQLIIMYAILTAVIIFVSLHLYKKKELLEKSKRAFISAAAHELKTPLAVIQNQCECILEGAVDDKKDEYIRSVYDEALRMNDIVSSLLTFNRLSSTDKIERESCNLTALVKEEANKYLPFARSAGAEITLEAEKDITVNCNPKLMALAVDNYLSNAVKYTTGEKKITVTLKKEKNCFMLEVFNTCEPLSTETAENIWELLERRDISRTRDGSSTGMGLPICKRIFECHSYSFHCKNTNNGVVFAVKGNL